MLENLTFFDTLKKSSINEIYKISKTKTYDEGRVIYYEKEPIKDIYYLKKGRVKTYKVNRFNSEIFICYIDNCDFITQICSLDVCDTFANAIALEQCEILLIDFEKLKTLLSLDIELSLVFHKIFLTKLKTMQDILDREIVFDGSAKVAHMLYNNLKLFNNSKRQEIASILNIQPETLSRILKKFERDGIIRHNKNSIEVVERYMLVDIFE